MKQIDLMFRTMVAELQKRTFDAQWSADSPPTSRFAPVTVDNRKDWYFDESDGAGGQKRRAEMVEAPIDALYSNRAMRAHQTQAARQTPGQPRANRFDSAMGSPALDAKRKNAAHPYQQTAKHCW